MSSPYPPPPGGPNPWQQPAPYQESSPFGVAASSQYDSVPPAPQHPAPQHPQAQYPQAQQYRQAPQYPQPPQQGYPPQVGYPQQPSMYRPPHKSRTGLVIGLVIGAVLLVGCGIGAVFVVPSLLNSGSDAGTTVTMPDWAGGLKKSSDTSATESIQGTLDGESGIKDPVSAEYVDTSSSSKPVIALGGTTTVSSIDSNLDEFFSQFSKTSGATVTNKVEAKTPPGIGGTTKCATVSMSGTQLGVCAWANHAALVATVCIGRDESAAADITLSMLVDIVHKD